MRRYVAVLVAVVAGLSFVATPTQAQPPVGCSGQDVTDLRTSDLADFLTGSDGDDVVALGDGDDQYFAADGSDVVCGNAGDDVLAGEGGADTLSGGVGSDIVAGLAGNDDVGGGLGSDVVDGNAGADIVRAGADGVRDDLFDGPGPDEIHGGPEDVWHRCDDGQVDDHSGFDGTIVPDLSC
jgi:hypothetical protein